MIMYQDDDRKWTRIWSLLHDIACATIIITPVAAILIAYYVLENLLANLPDR